MSLCEKCGRNLYKALTTRFPKNVVYFREKLPEFPSNPNITIPLEKVKEYNASYSELLEFASWICETTPEKFCRSDVMAAMGDWAKINRRIKEANESAYYD